MGLLVDGNSCLHPIEALVVQLTTFTGMQQVYIICKNCGGCEKILENEA